MLDQEHAYPAKHASSVANAVPYLLARQFMLHHWSYKVTLVEQDKLTHREA